MAITIPNFVKFFILSSIILLASAQDTYAQAYSFTGTVVNSGMEPIPYLSARIKDLRRGGRTNEEGKFTIMLPPGRHELIISGAGYKTLKSIIIMHKQNQFKQFVLETNVKEIKKVIISSKRKDRSREIIRKLISKKKDIQQGADQYSFEAYIKATVDKEKKKTKRNKSPSRKKNKKDTTRSNINETKIKTESSKQFAEVSLEVQRSYPKKIKEVRTGVNIKGNKTSFFYLSCTEGDFNFYENLIRVRALGKISFLSPFSSSGLIAYRYKYLEYFFKNGKFYHRIKFKPSTTSNALINGEVLIQDKTWVIKEIRAAFPNSHTPEYKKFEINATYKKINQKAWLPTQYNFNYLTRDKLQGQTVVNFRKYNIDTTFKRKYFDAELSATSKEAYERDSSFWQKTRTEPLTNEEIKIIHYKDSLYELTHSDHYRDSVEKDINRIRFINIIWSGQEIQNWRKERYISLPSLVQLWNPVAIGGPRYGLTFRYNKKYKNKRKVFLAPNITYGPWNKDIRGSIFGNYLINPFNRTSLNWNIGRKTANLFWNDAIVNLFDRSNYYQKENITVGIRRELINGLYINNTLEMGTRKNMHNLITNTYADSIFFNGENKKPIYFENYNAFFNELELSYTPQQKYIREPYEKVILGSRYPTFYAQWRKGIPGILKSTIRYDYIEIGTRQELNLGTIGLSNYNIKYGNFVNDGNVEAADYKYIARGNPWLFFNSLTSFQAMDSTFALFKGFVEGHYRHEFNGALLNKIPFVKKLKIAESAGAGFLLAPERDLRYVEVFAGIEKEFTIFRQPLRLGVWGVSSFANQFQKPFQFKFSLRAYSFQRDRWE